MFSSWSNSFVNGNKILVPFGNYKLEIKSSNSSGIESSNLLSYDLSVTPPWYLTQMAFFSYLIILGSSIYFYVKYSQGKTKRLMEEKRKEEELQEAHNLQMGLLAKENPNRDDLDIKILKTDEEVADLMGFLASDKARFITGQSTNINGGILTSR